MRSYHLVLILFVFLLGCTKNGNVDNDLRKEGLNGDVVKTSTLQFDAIIKFGEYLPILKPTSEYGSYKRDVHFNIAGNVDYITLFTNYIDTSNVIEYEYNEINLVSKSTDSFGETGQYEYDEEGVLLSRSFYNGTILVRKDIYQFEELSNFKIMNTYSSDGNLFRREKIHFNDFGREDSSISIYDRFSIQNVLYYDEQNLLVKEIFRTINESILNLEDDTELNYKYKFDSNGNWIQKIVESDIPEIHYREIEYLNGEITGNYDQIMVEATNRYNDEIVNNRIEESRQTIAQIASSSQAYYIKPTFMDGGGSSFKGLNFYNIKSGLEVTGSTDASDDYLTFKLKNIEPESFTIEVMRKDTDKVLMTANITPDNMCIDRNC